MDINNKKILSKSDEDELTIESLANQLKLVEENIIKEKKVFSKKMVYDGENLLQEIEIKKRKQLAEKLKLIKYLRRKTFEFKYFSIDELLKWDIFDLRKEYNVAKENNKNIFVRVWEIIIKNIK